MPHARTADLSAVSAALIVASDRVLSAEKPDRVSPRCRERLEEAGLSAMSASVVPESRADIARALRGALDRGDRLVIVAGCTGFGRGNEAPEAVRDVIAVELPGIAEAIRAHGLSSTPSAPLSRQVVGLTGRDHRAALVVASPGSVGGIDDTLDILTPLLGQIFAQLGEA